MTTVAAPTTVAGKPVGPVGFGMMSLTLPWKQTDHAAAAKVLKAALEQGANFWNGALFYGKPDANSLHLLKYYFTQYPEDAPRVVLSIKGAYDHVRHVPQGTPAQIRASVEEALRILDGRKTIDVFALARVDPTVPVEESVGALAGLVAEGKIGGVGLSEVGEATIRRAAAVTRIAAVEDEVSLFTTGPLTNGVAAACRELDIALIGYSPVGRGFLTGQLRKLEDLDEKDWRRFLPRFQPAVFGQNIKLADAVGAIAERKGAAIASVAVSWARRQGVIPIPGTSTVERVVENGTDVELSGEDLAEIQELLDTLPIAGERYGGRFEELLDA